MSKLEEHQKQLLVKEQLTLLGNRVLKNDKDQKRDFNGVSSHCKHRELTEYAKNRKPIYACKSPILTDPKFGWACDMGNCPHMNGAMDWRANNV